MDTNTGFLCKIFYQRRLLNLSKLVIFLIVSKIVVVPAFANNDLYSLPIYNISACAANSQVNAKLKVSRAKSKYHQFLRDIKKTMGKNAPIGIFFTRDIDFASAVNNLNGKGNAIVLGLNLPWKQYSNDTILGVIAHEAGHFLDKNGVNCQHAVRENAADMFAGCYFARSGKTIDQATSMIREILIPVRNAGNSLAIPISKRVSSIRGGYFKCRGELKS